MKVTGVSGSLRTYSYNTRLLEICDDLMPAGVDFEIIRLDNIPFYNEDLDGEKKPEAVQLFLEHVRQADVLLFATPEYNHSISGVLKNAIDWASRPAFNSPLLGKPCGILSAATSPVGGARAQADLKNILSSTLAPVYPSVEFLLANAHEKFDAQGHLADETARLRLARYCEGLVNWARNI